MIQTLLPLALALTGADMTPDDQALVAEAKAVIASYARDPESLTYSDVHVSRVTLTGEKARLAMMPEGTKLVSVCAMVNGRNGFGGKTGFTQTAVIFEGKGAGPYFVQLDPGYETLPTMFAACPSLRY